MNHTSRFIVKGEWIYEWFFGICDYLSRENSNLIKDSKQKLYWIANYEAAFQNLSSTSKEKSFQWKKNFSNILNDFCWI